MYSKTLLETGKDIEITEYLNILTDCKKYICKMGE